MGQTSLAGSGQAVSTTSASGTTSTTMGDAKIPVVGAIILDGYSRAYAMNFASSLSRAAQEAPLAQSLGGDYRTAAAGAKGMAVSVTINRNLTAQANVGLAQTGLTYEDSRKAKAAAGMALSRLTPKTAVAFGFSESGRTLQQRLSGHETNAFLVARDPLTRNGFHADASTSMGLRQNVGPVALTVTSERGRVFTPGLVRQLEDPSYTISSVTADRRFGPAILSVGATRLDERETMLGSRFSSAFARGGATSTFLDTSASYDLGRGWGAFASYRRGWTSMAGTGALVDHGRLSTDAWAFDLSKANAFRGGDKLAFRVMQPLRVRSGGFDLNVPVSYDYSNGSVGYERQALSLAPSGREIDFEAAYSLGLLGGRLGINAFLRTDPGHIEAIGSDIGGAVRYSVNF
jgi:hypothetical protein